MMTTTRKRQGLVAVALGIAWLCAPAVIAQQRSDARKVDAAKRAFEERVVVERQKQRAAQRQFSEHLDALVKSTDDKASRQELAHLAVFAKQSQDFSLVIESALQLRSQLSGSLQTKYDELLEPLSECWSNYRQCKLDYQKTLAESLARRWSRLSLEEKRIELSDYLALADQRPAWLLRTCPVPIKEFVPKTARQAIDKYAGLKKELVARIQKELKPQIDATIKLAEQTAKDSAHSSAIRLRATQISNALQKPYGAGLRGVLLCTPDPPGLPADLRTACEQLLSAFLKRLELAEADHQRLLDDLNAHLKSLEEDRIAQFKFEEQMAIELFVSENDRLIQPVRVLANRSERTRHFENARLLMLRADNENWMAQVEFTIDGSSAWVASDRISVLDNELPVKHRQAVPAEGPGQRVTDETDLSVGQVYAHSPSGWKPVNVVDDSPLGVIIRWQGSAEPIEYFVDRQHLRIDAP